MSLGSTGGGCLIHSGAWAPTLTTSYVRTVIQYYGYGDFLQSVAAKPLRDTNGLSRWVCREPPAPACLLQSWWSWQGLASTLLLTRSKLTRAFSQRPCIKQQLSIKVSRLSGPILQTRALGFTMVPVICLGVRANGPSAAARSTARVSAYWQLTP